MLAPIAYRGPDDEAIDIRPGAALAFRRLAIVDVANGRQPMTTADGDLVLVCNGEIYNHEELEAELTSRGHRFRTRCDVEVLLHAYREWGAECATRLRGIFAFAVWDAPRQALFLCRDRSGVKPLFLRVSGDELHFASEAKALLAHPSCPRRLDVLSCFAISEADALLEDTPFAGLHQLGPGCSLTFTASSGLAPRRYWRYAPLSDRGADEADADVVAGFREELARVVSLELMADVPVGAYLSGGLDSSIVVALAAAKLPDLPTFTSISPGSEDPWFAFVMCRAVPFEHPHFIGFSPRSLVGSLPAVAWAAEGTFDLGFMARFQLATAARAEGVKVLLSGQGADELLGGYAPRYSAFASAAKRRALAARFIHRGWDDAAVGLRQEPDEARPDASEPGNVAAALQAQHAALSHTLLRFEDRMGMLAGVEVRVPFLDHRLVERVASIGSEARRRLLDDKRLLREAARGLLPESIRLRAKLGFNAQLPPMSRALDGAEQDTFVGTLLREESVREKGYFDPKLVRRLGHASNHRALDVVLIVHVLDELFVSHFDPSRFERIEAPLVVERTIDETSMPVAALRLFADKAPRGADVPVIAPSITQVGVLHAIAGSDAPALVFQREDGRPSFVPLPAELDAASALDVVRTMDGARTYGDVSARLGVSLEVVLSLARLLLDETLLEHASPG